nr:MAG TPA: hypothetical protein [Bacteriophage sp.]
MIICTTIVVIAGMAIVHMEAIPMDFAKLPVVYTYATNNGTDTKLLVITINEMKDTKEVNLSNCCFMI